jgi:hypothetical protein
MSSRQVNFYSTPLDYAEMEKRLLKIGPFLMFASRSYDGNAPLLSGPLVDHLQIDHRCLYLALPAHKDLVELETISTQPYKLVDVMRSPVIEFDLGNSNKDRLDEARMFLFRDYLEDGRFFLKDQGFLDWSQKMLRAAVRGWKRVPPDFHYFGPEAMKLKEKGIALGPFFAKAKLHS